MAILPIYLIHSRILMVFIVSKYLTCTHLTHISFSLEIVFQLSASSASARCCFIRLSFNILHSISSNLILLNLVKVSSEPASQSLTFQVTRSILCENTVLLTISLNNISFFSGWHSIFYP